MSLPLKKYETGKLYYYKPHKRKKTKKSKNPILFILSLILLGAYAFYACPYNYDNYLKPLFVNRFLNRNIKISIKDDIHPHLYYTNNSFVNGGYVSVEKPSSSKELADINMVYEMTDTKNKVLELFKSYPKLTPYIYVWEYKTGAGFAINGDTPVPTASIIKIPIACAFMRMLDRSSQTEKPVSLQDKMMYTEQFKTDGSGILKKTQTNVNYSLNHLAEIMITHSDNSATNMILYQIGGMLGFNREMRNLGLKITSMQNWLPDLDGTNKSTAREIATLLYNIDNPKFISAKYKNVLKEYLVKTKNTHLLKEKLPDDAKVLHKTGNIGTMLGDAGIIYTASGKKYVVCIMVKRPHNDLSARQAIQDASLIIFDDISKL